METQAARTIETSKGNGVGFEPETILPSQYFDRFQIDASLQPEKRLMLAVLEDAVGTFQKYAVATGRRARRLFTESEEWFASDETSWPYSFLPICQALGLEPEYVRRGLQRWRHGQVEDARYPGNVIRFPFRRVNGRRHSITGPREYLKKIA